MANRFWIGGTGSWSEIAHWSATSGGAGNQTVPTSSDDVFIDSNSGFGGGGTITLPSGDPKPTCNNFVSNTSSNYTIDSEGNFEIYGSFTGESGITWGGFASLYFLATTTGKTILTAGVSIPLTVNFSGVGGGWILLDNLTITNGGEFYQDNGTFDANDHNVTANDFYFYADTGYTPTVIMGSGTWQNTGSFGDWYIDEPSGEVVTITPETSTIKLTNNGAFRSSAKTYYNLWFTSSGNIYDSGACTFNDLKIDAGISVQFPTNITQTVSSFTALGTAGNLINLNTPPQGAVQTVNFTGGVNYIVTDVLTIVSGNNNCTITVTAVNGGGLPTSFDITTGGTGYSVASGLSVSGGSGTGGTVDISQVSPSGQFTLSKSSGVVSCDYLDISNSNATGGATWYAGSHSNNTINNSGWLFEDAPVGGGNHNNLLLLGVG